MKKHNVTLLVQQTSQCIGIQNQILYDPELQNMVVLGHTVINYNDLIIAITFDNLGVAVCRFGIESLQIHPDILFPEALSCQSQNQYSFIEQQNVLSTYWNQNDPDFFYIGTSTPPGVNEINIKDPYNILITNYYILPTEKPQYIGLQTIASNKNLVVQQILNIQTNKRVLRIFNRNQSRMNIARCQYSLPQYSRSNFFVFPDLYQDIIIFRDEMRINSTSFSDYKVIVSGRVETNFPEAYLYDIFNVTINVQNFFEKREISFNVTFVDDNYMAITKNSNSNQSNQDIFYNCGDNKFQSSLTDMFNGPSVILRIDNDSVEQSDDINIKNQKNGNKFFQIMNQGIKIQSNLSYFEKDGCDDYQIFPDIPNGENYNLPLIFICVKKGISRISSYLVCQDCDGQAILSNEIEIPKMTFIYTGFDFDNRVFYIIMESTEDTEGTLQFSNEIHFFSVWDDMVWVSFQQLPNFVKDFSLKNFTIFEYNDQNNQGTMISSNVNNSQLVIAFEITFSHQSNLTKLADYTFQVDNSDKGLGQIEMAAVSQDGFIFAMTSKNYMIVFQCIKIIKKLIILRSIDVLNVQSGEQAQLPYDIQIYQNFMVMLGYPNRMTVYTIQNEINLVYLMVLPLYNEYSSFNLIHEDLNNRDYDSNQKKEHLQYDRLLKTAFYENYFSVLMTSNSYKSNNFTAMIFTYSLSENQHNSLLMVEDASEFVENCLDSESVDIQLIGNSVQRSLILISSQNIEVYEINFENNLMITQNTYLQQQLLSQCEKLKGVGFIDEFSSNQDDPKIIASLNILAKIGFENEDSQINNSISLNVYSQNNGLRITPFRFRSNVDYSFTYEEKNSHNVKGLNLSLQDIVEGYNMIYSIECTYHDINKNPQDCSKQIVNKTTSNLYTFYLELVTQTRKVLQSFTISNLHVMFDSLGFITFYKLPTTGSLSQIDRQSLISLNKQFSQIEKLGCLIDKFIDVRFQFEDIDVEDGVYNAFILVYQCSVQKVNVIKVACLKVYDFDDVQDGIINEENYEFTEIHTSLKMPYRVVDIERTDLVKSQKDSNLRTARMILSCEIPDSPSNGLYIYDFTLDLPKNSASFALQRKLLSVNQIRKDTFKTEQMFRIDGAGILVIVDESYGAYIFDMDSMQILKDLDLKADTQFYDQMYKQIGPLKAYGIALNMPHTIHVVSNYGVYIYNFNISLENRNEIFPKFSKNLEPISKQFIPFQIDMLNYEIAQNEFGYAFLTIKELKQSIYQISLAVVSFYAIPSNQFFRLITIPDVGSDCHSLTAEDGQYIYAYGEQYQNEDSLIVSFICDSQFLIAETFLRPYIQIDFHNISDSTKLKNGRQVTAQQQFNEYNITVFAKNEFYTDDKVSVLVKIKNKSTINNQLPIYYVAILITVSVFITVIIFLELGFGKDQNNKEHSIKTLKNNIALINVDFPEDSIKNRITLQISDDSKSKNKLKKSLLDLQEINKRGGGEEQDQVNDSSRKSKQRTKSRHAVNIDNYQFKKKIDTPERLNEDFKSKTSSVNKQSDQSNKESVSSFFVQYTTNSLENQNSDQQKNKRKSNKIQ